MEALHHEAAKTSIHLPEETLIQMFSNLSLTKSSQSNSAPLFHVSDIRRLWKSCTKAHSSLGRNSSLLSIQYVNAHFKGSELSNVMERLDMNTLVHDEGTSLTIQVLGSWKGQLEELLRRKQHSRMCIFFFFF